MLAAVSGGPDSTALLLILSRLAPSLDLTLTAAHFDHGLRGRLAARRERSYVEALCQRLAVPLQVGAGDTRAHARAHGLSREEAARELRYAFLAEAAVATGCTVVATGHTADDQAETVLLHIIRGSGLDGLAGMAARGPWPLTGQEGPGRGPPPPLLATRGGGPLLSGGGRGAGGRRQQPLARLPAQPRPPGTAAGAPTVQPSD